MRRIILLVLLLVCVSGYMLWYSNIMVDRALALAFPASQYQYRYALPTVSGAILAQDITIRSLEDRSRAPLLFASMRVDMPLFDWLASLFHVDMQQRIADITQLSLVFNEAQASGSLAVAHELLNVGGISASPFEAAGCAKTDFWLSHELEAMGLLPGATRFSIVWQLKPGRIVKKQNLFTPGVSQVKTVRTFRTRGVSSLTDLPNAPGMMLESDQWVILDNGFVSARNDYCAQHDKVTKTQFLARHLAAVGRIMQATGLAASPQLARLYSGFATHGGDLQLDVRYLPALPLADYQATTMGQWVEQLHGRLSRGGTQVQFGLQQVAERPFVEQSYPGSVWAMMEMEGSVPASLADTKSDLTDLTVPGKTPVQRQSALTDAPQTARLATRIDTSVTALLQQDSATLDYQDLSDLVGVNVKVYIQGRRPRVLQIAGIEKSGVKVRHRMSGGWASYILPERNFIKAELF